MPYKNKLGTRQRAMLELIRALPDMRWHRGCGRYSSGPWMDERTCESLLKRGCLQRVKHPDIFGHPPIFTIPEKQS